jgi:hypothetical protein
LNVNISARADWYTLKIGKGLILLWVLSKGTYPSESLWDAFPLKGPTAISLFLWFCSALLFEQNNLANFELDFNYCVTFFSLLVKLIPNQV